MKKKKKISLKRLLRLTSLNCYWMDCPFLSSRFKRMGPGLKVWTRSIIPNSPGGSEGAKQPGCGMVVNKACGETLALLLVAHFDHLGKCHVDFHAKDFLKNSTLASWVLRDIQIWWVNFWKPWTSSILIEFLYSFFPLEEVFSLSLKITAASAL